MLSFNQAVGGVIENFPANFKVPLDYIQTLADRRRPGQSSITTPRKETDQIQILSGKITNILYSKVFHFIYY